MNSSQGKTYILAGKITAEDPLSTCSADLKARVWKEGDPTPIPTTIIAGLGERLMFPATGLRGRLRRASLDAVRDYVIELTGEKKPFTLPEHYLLSVGGIKGAGEQEKISVSLEAEWRRKNPLLSIYGAGAAGVLGFVQGRLSVGNALADDVYLEEYPNGRRAAVQGTILGESARTDVFYRDPQQVAYLSDEDVENLIRQSKGGKERSNIKGEIKSLEKALKAAKVAARSSGVQDEVERIEGEIEALNARVVDVKKETGTSDVALGRPLQGWRAIPQKTVMSQRMLIVRSNPIELGLLLKTLDRLAWHPFVGAHFANGNGQISGRWEVFEASTAGKESLGEVVMSPFEPLYLNGAKLVDAMGAFEAFMSSKTWDFGIPSADAK